MTSNENHMQVKQQIKWVGHGNTGYLVRKAKCLHDPSTLQKTDYQTLLRSEILRRPCVLSCASTADLAMGTAYETSRQC